ncbi:hypothetical protein OU800_07875 [Pseudomonas sp. GOM7]|uniref:hypothetical protein n=1 Tax=Pseudomonas sp. GOM7 TaxID=2998079 RepID=UPI00227AACE2|nr:hypothetical protein [Pseudomonas sp. GOM7]WAJ39133.1 hypothetical protein OU800_07875 [Pseudomonas sp. GOM7]
MKKTIAFSLSLLSGCSIFPETKEELAQSGNKSPEYCFAYERTLVESRVERYLLKCFKPSYVSTGNGVGFVNNQQLKKETTDEATELSVYSPSGTGAGYFLNILISNGNFNCTTKMSATAYNFVWERYFDKLNESAIGGDPRCLL